VNGVLRIASRSFVLFLLPVVLTALQVSPADSELTLVREARPWLQELDDEGLLRPFDILASPADRSLVMRAGGLELTLAPDSLLLITQLSDEGPRLRLLYGMLDVDASDTAQIIVLETATGDISLDLSGVRAEVHVSHRGGVLLVVSHGTAAARRGTPGDRDNGTEEAFANTRRALHYDFAQGLFTAIPTRSPGGSAQILEQYDGDASSRRDSYPALAQAIDRFNERYNAARTHRGLFDEAFERDRAGLPNNTLREDLGSSGSQALVQALEAGYRLFPLFHDVLGAQMVRHALVRRIGDEPDSHVSSSDMASGRSTLASDHIGEFIERFSEITYQARIARLFEVAP
jgi:hypothetical protein